jgi:hypothetical protein
MSVTRELGPFGLECEANLRENRPKMYEALKASGRLLPFLLQRQQKANEALKEYRNTREVSWQEAKSLIDRDYLNFPTEEEQPVLGESRPEASPGMPLPSNAVYSDIAEEPAPVRSRRAPRKARSPRASEPVIPLEHAAEECVGAVVAHSTTYTRSTRGVPKRDAGRGRTPAEDEREAATAAPETAIDPPPTRSSQNDKDRKPFLTEKSLPFGALRRLRRKALLQTTLWYGVLCGLLAMAFAIWCLSCGKFAMLSMNPWLSVAWACAAGGFLMFSITCIENQIDLDRRITYYKKSRHVMDCMLINLRQVKDAGPTAGWCIWVMYEFPSETDGDEYLEAAASVFRLVCMLSDFSNPDSRLRAKAPTIEQIVEESNKLRRLSR